MATTSRTRWRSLGQAGSIQEHGPHAIRRRPDGGMAVIVGNNETIADDALDLTSPVLKDKDAQFLPYFAELRAERARRRAQRDLRLEPERQEVPDLLRRQPQRLRLRLQPRPARRSCSTATWSGTSACPGIATCGPCTRSSTATTATATARASIPPYYLDSLPPVRDLGRGSPVGVEFYTSYAYPKEFFDNLFEADWSRGRLLYTALTPAGATYTARTDRAEFVHGEPFNITDVEVGPDGLMYFTTGGRNTSGGLWRLRYKGALPAAPDMTGMLAVVRQPQPLSSWGWAAIEKAKASMGAGVRRRAREAGAQRRRPRRPIARARSTRCSATAPRRRRRCCSALVADKSAEVRAAVGLRRRRPG